MLRIEKRPDTYIFLIRNETLTYITNALRATKSWTYAENLKRERAIAGRTINIQWGFSQIQFIL